MPFNSGVIEYVYVSGIADPTSPYRLQDVTFSGAHNLIAASGYSWDFGDGSGAVGQTPNHAYSSIGLYSGELIISGIPFVITSGLNTYMYDDFSDTVATNWGTAFNNWNPVDFSGAPGITRSGNFWDSILPSGYYVGGKFDIQLRLQYGDNDSGPNHSTKLFLVPSGEACAENGPGLLAVPGTTPDGIEFSNGGSTISGIDWTFVPYRYVDLRMLKGYYIPSGELTPIDAVGSGDYVFGYCWREAIDDSWHPLGSFQHTSGYYNICLEGSDQHGFSLFQFAAESGLYYDTTTLSSASGTFEVTVSGLDFNISGIDTSAYGDVSGDMEFNYLYTISGDISVFGDVNGSIVYVPASYGQAPAGNAIKTFLPVLSNKRTSPYYPGNSRDSLQAKFELYNKHRRAYTSGLPVELWLNYDTTWQVRLSGFTNRYGMVHFNYPCTPIPDIDCCLGVAKITVGDFTYNSNIVRFNFIQGALFDETYIIDASTGSTDRSAFNIFDGSGRLDEFDRMWS